MFRLALIAASIFVFSSDLHAEAKGPGLFETQDVLRLTMPVDFANLCRPATNPDCDFTPTVFEFVDQTGASRTVPIEIRRRDGWRAMETNCQVPTLFVRFSPEHTAGTPFEGQTTLALTSHCGKGFSQSDGDSRPLPDKFESYVSNEYLGYQLYNLVSDMSLKVRFVRMTYTNPRDPRRDFTHNGFFAEHFDSLAERFDAQLVPVSGLDPEKLDTWAAEQVAMFNFMIGNTDWSIPDMENIVILGLPDGRQVPVPYDLDLSGLVNAHYAVPPPDLPIRTVKERYFQGYCEPEMDWDALYTKFIELEDDVLKTLIDTPGLGRGDRRSSGVYLLDFFDLLESPEQRQVRVAGACLPKDT